MKNSAWNAWFHFQECAFVGTQLLDSTQLQKSGFLIYFPIRKRFSLQERFSLREYIA